MCLHSELEWQHEVPEKHSDGGTHAPNVALAAAAT